MKAAIAVGAVLIALFCALPASSAEQGGKGEDPALRRALENAPLPLEHGLAASLREGIPISAKYELEDHGADELQLSVYTMKGGESIDVDLETGDVWLTDPTFAEVIVDYRTGKIGKVLAIEEGEDLAAARSQGRMMAQAKRSLEAATILAVKAQSGYRAVSTSPELKDGQPVVKVILVNGSKWKTVYQTLD